MKKNITRWNTLSRLAPSLKAPLWIAFVKALEEEMMNISSKIEEKKTTFDISLMTYDQLMDISQTLGIPFNATVDSSIDFLRREVESIPFKILYKDTSILYESFYKALQRRGQVYSYYYRATSEAIVRNAKDLFFEFSGQKVTEPILHLSERNFTGEITKALKIDTGVFLDAGSDTWNLDTIDSSLTTNHIAVELFLNELITKNRINPLTREEEELKEFLGTWDYFDYLQVNTDFSRRVIQVPHIGGQLSVLADSSGIVNPFDTTYSCPKIKLKVCTDPEVLDSLTSLLNIAYIEFGIGSQDNLPTKEGTGSFPDKLFKRVSRRTLLFDEKYSTEDWFGVVGEYRAQEITNFGLHDKTGYLLDSIAGAGEVNGKNNSFTGQLPFAPIKPKNVNITMTHLTESFVIQDDGKGVLYGKSAKGTINYLTGEYSFSTTFDYSETVFLDPVDYDDKKYDVILDIDPPFTPMDSTEPIICSIVPNKVKLVYNIGKRRFISYDDGNGNFTGSHILSASIDYLTGVFQMEFDQPMTEGEKVELSYSRNRNYTPSVDTLIEADFYFTDSAIEITEVGLYTENKELLAYATFPPIEFINGRHHLSFGFGIKKTPFDSEIV